MNLFLDIETVPSQHPEALATVRAGLKPPGTLKKAESIAKWWEDEADQAAADAWRKQALDGGLHGEIVSIAMASDLGQWVRCRAVGGSEAELIAAAFERVQGWRDELAALLAPEARAWQAGIFPVAHNAQFDMGFLWRRARVNRVAVPDWLPGPSARAGKDYGCTMLLWAGYGGRVSLDSLCGALGVPSPKEGGIDGSQVFDAWLAGETERIAAYNLRDTVALAEVWDRLHGGVEVTP